MRYGKFISQLVAVALAALVAALTDGRVEGSEWINVAVLTLGAVAVLGAGNLPSGVWAHTKLIVSAATAVLVLAQSLAGGGITTSEWLQLALAALAALGVYIAPGPVLQTYLPQGR